MMTRARLGWHLQGRDGLFRFRGHRYTLVIPRAAVKPDVAPTDQEPCPVFTDRENIYRTGVCRYRWPLIRVPRSPGRSDVFFPGGFRSRTQGKAVTARREGPAFFHGGAGNRCGTRAGGSGRFLTAGGKPTPGTRRFSSGLLTGRSRVPLPLPPFLPFDPAKNSPPRSLFTLPSN